MQLAMLAFIEFSTVRGTIQDVRIFTCEKEISAIYGIAIAITILP